MDCKTFSTFSSSLLFSILQFLRSFTASYQYHSVLTDQATMTLTSKSQWLYFQTNDFCFSEVVFTLRKLSSWTPAVTILLSVSQNCSWPWYLEITWE